MKRWWVFLSDTVWAWWRDRDRLMKTATGRQQSKEWTQGKQTEKKIQKGEDNMRVIDTARILVVQLSFTTYSIMCLWAWNQLQGTQTHSCCKLQVLANMPCDTSHRQVSVMLWLNASKFSRRHKKKRSEETISERNLCRKNSSIKVCLWLWGLSISLFNTIFTK